MARSWGVRSGLAPDPTPTQRPALRRWKPFGPHSCAYGVFGSCGGRGRRSGKGHTHQRNAVLTALLVGDHRSAALHEAPCIASCLHGAASQTLNDRRPATPRPESCRRSLLTKRPKPSRTDVGKPSSACPHLPLNLCGRLYTRHANILSPTAPPLARPSPPTTQAEPLPPPALLTWAAYYPRPSRSRRPSLYQLPSVSPHAPPRLPRLRTHHPPEPSRQPSPRPTGRPPASRFPRRPLPRPSPTPPKAANSCPSAPSREELRRPRPGSSPSRWRRCERPGAETPTPGCRARGSEQPPPRGTPAVYGSTRGRARARAADNGGRFTGQHEDRGVRSTHHRL